MSKYNDITKPPPPLPSVNLKELKPGVSLLLPLTRRGYGPGLIVLTTDTSDPLAIKDGVPSHLVKWAEEGYAVVGIEERAFAASGDVSTLLLTLAVDALAKCDKCEPKGIIGLVGTFSFTIPLMVVLFDLANIYPVPFSLRPKPMEQDCTGPGKRSRGRCRHHIRKCLRCNRSG